MSRCFLFPPPGYAKNGVLGEALIESIKLQKGKEKAKAEKSKEKKREKKEKKKEKKCKELEKSIKIDDPKLTSKGREESEQLEKSGLTEELEQPSYLSDSMQSSNKRKGDSSSFNSSQTHGNILRIRLPSQKNRESDAASMSKDQLCSASGRVNCAALQKLPDQEQCFNNLKTDSNFKKVAPAMPHLASGKNKIVSQSEASLGVKSHKDERRLTELYNLMELLPLPSDVELSDKCDHWLFEGRCSDEHRSSKRLKSDNDAVACGSLTMWPRACHLPEAEIHALPYTVPF